VLQRVRRAALIAAAAGLPAACTAPPPPAAVTTLPPATSTTTIALRRSLLAEGRQWAFRVRSVACLATGSSFATAYGIVTNRHVAAGSTTLQMSTWNGTDFDVAVSGISSGPDLALLNPEGEPAGTQDAPLAATAAAPGQSVYAVGYPEGDALSVIAGHVVGYVSGSTYGVSGQVLEITNPIKPGNSGSALLDSAGRVVGVVFATGTINGLGLAVPLSELRSFLADPGSRLLPDCVD
jgi:S1-C subfamily serine protease